MIAQDGDGVEGASPICWIWELEGFDPRDHLPVALWRHTDAVRYVVGRVAQGLVLDARRRGRHAGWVSLRWADIAPLFGKSGTWNRVRRTLLQRGILQCDERFTAREKAKWYRLGAAWWRQGLERRVIRDHRLAARIGGANAAPEERGVRVPAHEHLSGWLARFDVDEAESRRWTCRRRRSWKQNLTALKLAVIRSGAAALKVDSYGRVHSPVVNLRAVARRALRVGGRPLAEVDVANAQPLLLGYLVAMAASGDWPIDRVKEMGRKRARGAIEGYLSSEGGRAKGEERRKGQEEGEETARDRVIRSGRPSGCAGPRWPEYWRRSRPMTTGWRPAPRSASSRA
jgi:hypothetical protein